MAISDSAKVDLLYKKYFGVTKSDLPANKSPSNEAIASPLLVRGDTVWQQASSIPATAAAVTGIVQSYNSTGRVECTADTTTVPISSVYPTWKTNLTDWIPSEFGSSYFIKVYVDNTGASDPSSTGTQIFDSGSGNTGEWNFDYSAGVLNFVGGTIPAVLTSSKKIFVMGYRYIGLKGVNNFGNLIIGNITITGNTITGNTGVTFGGNITGNINGNVTGTILTPTQPYITTVGTLGNLSVDANITTGNLLTNAFFWANGNPVMFSYYGNGNVSGLMANFGSNTITTTGNITGQHFGNVYTDYISGQTGNIITFTGTGALQVPVGTVSNRPAGYYGMMRFNTDTPALEYYDGAVWVPVTNTVTDQQIIPDGSSNTYTLQQEATAVGTIVSINGTLQNPSTAYSIVGDQITFNETPLTDDIIDVRFLGASVTINNTLSEDLTVSGNVTVTGLFQAPQATKASNAPGTVGQITWDANYIYVCTATNTWKRTALTGGY